jgi:hypothetical protein
MCSTRHLGSHVRFLSRTVFSQRLVGPLPPLSRSVRPPGCGNVNTRQLPSTQHHRIASHATVPLCSPASPSRRPRYATPVYIYLHFDPTTSTSPPNTVLTPDPRSLAGGSGLFAAPPACPRSSFGPGPALVVSASRFQDPVCRRANCLGPLYFESPVTPPTIDPQVIQRAVGSPQKVRILIFQLSHLPSPNLPSNGAWSPWSPRYLFQPQSSTISPPLSTLNLLPLTTRRIITPFSSLPFQLSRERH